MYDLDTIAAKSAIDQNIDKLVAENDALLIDDAPLELTKLEELEINEQAYYG
jgi:hypothetical protein